MERAYLAAATPQSEHRQTSIPASESSSSMEPFKLTACRGPGTLIGHSEASAPRAGPPPKAPSSSEPPWEGRLGTERVELITHRSSVRVRPPQLHLSNTEAEISEHGVVDRLGAKSASASLACPRCQGTTTSGHASTPASLLAAASSAGLRQGLIAVMDETAGCAAPQVWRRGRHGTPPFRTIRRHLGVGNPERRAPNPRS
jgi:hypothetical protein